MSFWAFTILPLVLLAAVAAAGLNAEVSFGPMTKLTWNKKEIPVDARNSAITGNLDLDSWKLAADKFDFQTEPFKESVYSLRFVTPKSSDSSTKPDISLDLNRKFLKLNFESFLEVSSPGFAQNIPVSLSFEGVFVNNFGFAMLISEFEIPATKNPVLNMFLGLPKRVSMQLDLHFRTDSAIPKETAFYKTFCNDHFLSLDIGTPVLFEVGISKLGIGHLPSFRYDPAVPLGEHPIGGSGFITSVNSKSIHFKIPKDDIYFAPLDVISGASGSSTYTGIAEVDITLLEDLEFDLDVCSGSMQMTFNASFIPKTFDHTWGLPSLSVVSILTTDTDSAVRFDEWGRGRVIGIAEIPKSTSTLENLILGLPTQAKTDMPALIHVGCSGWTAVRSQFSCN